MQPAIWHYSFVDIWNKSNDILWYDIPAVLFVVISFTLLIESDRIYCVTYSPQHSEANFPVILLHYN